jgi:hypothetical protein
MSDFYIGYRPEAPRRLARFVFRLVLAIAVVVFLLDLALVTGQKRFPAAAFEYDKPQSFRGTVRETPLPSLVMSLPSATLVLPETRSYLLVAPGKHSAAPLVAGMDGRQVEFTGRLIYRESGTMIEIAPGSLRVGGPSPLRPPVTPLGHVTLTGEVVDTKCYLGVMNPGQGKPHRDCASLCLRGGIPAGLAVYVGQGKTDLYLLLDAGDRPLGRALLQHAGEKLTLTGEAFRAGDQLYLRTGEKGAASH